MLDDAKNLPDDPSELKDLVALLARELKNRDLKIADLRHQLAGHKRHRFGSKSESLDQLQLALALVEQATGAHQLRVVARVDEEQWSRQRHRV